MANDLKPCPFCQAHLIEAPALSTRNNRVMVHPNFDEGSRCPASSVVVHTGQTVSVERWNSRALHALPADLAGLTKAIQFLGWVSDSYEAHAKTADHAEKADAYRGSAIMAREHKRALEALAGRQVAVTDEAFSALEALAGAVEMHIGIEDPLIGPPLAKAMTALDRHHAQEDSAPPAPQAAEEHAIGALQSDEWEYTTVPTPPASGKVEAEAVEPKPFMYGIMDADGTPFFEEFCVHSDRQELEDVIDEHLGQRVVALYSEATVAAMQAEIERLNGKLEAKATEAAAMRQLRETAEAELAKLREGLEPFASIADLVDSETEGFSETDEFELMFGNHLFERFKLSTFRRSRALLPGETE